MENEKEHLVDEIYLEGKMSAYRAAIEFLQEDLKIRFLYAEHQKRIKRKNRSKLIE